MHLGLQLQFFSCCICTTFIFLQGDILFLRMTKDPIRTGEIVVFNVDVCSFLVQIVRCLFFLISICFHFAFSETVGLF